MARINIEIPDKIAENYHTPDELIRGMYEDIVISEFQKGNLSIRESAEILGLLYEEFIDFLGKRKLSFITATQNELEASYKDFEKFLQNYKKS